MEKKQYLALLVKMMKRDLEIIGGECPHNDIAKEAGYYKAQARVARVSIESTVNMIEKELRCMQESGDDFDGEGRII